MKLILLESILKIRGFKGDSRERSFDKNPRAIRNAIEHWKCFLKARNEDSGASVGELAIPRLMLVAKLGVLSLKNKGPSCESSFKSHTTTDGGAAIRA